MGKKKKKKLKKKKPSKKQVQQKIVQEVNNEMCPPQPKNYKISFKERLVFIFAYFFSPTIAILISYFYVRNFFINRMITIKVGSFDVLNSENAINNVIAPFFTTFFLFISFILTYVILTRVVSSHFIQEKYHQFAKKSLKCAEIGILLLGLMTMIYMKSEEFPYTSTQSYKGYMDEKKEYLYMEHILYDSDHNEIARSGKPSTDGKESINSIGINSSNAKFSYKVVLKLSQIFYSVSRYFSVIATIAGAIIFPLRNFTSEKKRNAMHEDII